MLDWIDKAPLRWPTIPRRVFAVTFPFSGAIWLACWAAVFVAGAAVAVAVAVITFPPALIYKFWTGSDEDLMEIMFDGTTRIFEYAARVFSRPSR